MEGFDPARSFGPQVALDYDVESVRGDEDGTAEFLGVGKVVLDVCRYDPVTQILDEQHVRIGFGGWNGEPFNAASWRHVSVYARSSPATP